MWPTETTVDFVLYKFPTFNFVLHILKLKKVLHWLTSIKCSNFFSKQWILENKSTLVR